MIRKKKKKKRMMIENESMMHHYIRLCVHNNIIDIYNSNSLARETCNMNGIQIDLFCLGRDGISVGCKKSTRCFRKGWLLIYNLHRKYEFPHHLFRSQRCQNDPALMEFKLPFKGIQI
jgi:hypothetical protein